MTHKEVVEISYKWILNNTQCGIAFKELNTHASNGEYPDVIGFSAWGYSCLIEVKVSRSDFLCDKKKSFRKDPSRGMGTHRYYCCPVNLIKVSDLPDGWGLIYVNEKGKAICVHNPYKRKVVNKAIVLGHPGFEKNIHAEHGFMYSVLRRLHLKGHIPSIYDKEYNYTGKPIELNTETQTSLIL